MSRRKQARPIKHLEEDGVPGGSIKAPVVATVTRSSHGDSPTSCSEEDVSCGGPIDASLVAGEPLACPRCQEHFTAVPQYLTHKATCERQDYQHLNSTPSDSEDMVISEYDEEEDEEVGGKRLEKDRRHRQDAANNNSVDEEEGEREIDGLPVEFPFPLPSSTSHVTLEALQNTKVAVAQFAATAMANNADNEAALQELAVLQSTLFTLQHQQVFQLQLINQLQQQLTINRVNKDVSPSSPTTEPALEPTVREVSPERPLSPSEPTVPTPQTPPISQPVTRQPSLVESTSETPASEPSPTLPAIPCPMAPSMCSISSSLAASIITNNDPLPSSDEPNTLEMLQKRAQEVLDNASQGLLANNLADELAFRKSKGSLSPYDSKSGRNEPFFKHRCRYCGKVFGSDSALQIHIRSHTGERPFKCNVCGSRFTTKGNLKVHFQRHTAKFPHIKMNPNPIPEHLDKYHPPLLAQISQQPGGLSPGGPAHHPSHQFSPGHPFPPSSIPIYRPPMPPTDLIQPRLPTSLHRPQENNSRILPSYPIFVRREEQQDVPENLSKPTTSPAPADISPETPMKTEPVEELKELRGLNEEPKEPLLTNNSITPKQEIDMYNDHDIEQDHLQSPGMYDDCSMDSKYSNEDLLRVGSPLGMEHGEHMHNEHLHGEHMHGEHMSGEHMHGEHMHGEHMHGEHMHGDHLHGEHMQDEPENLSNKSNSVTMPLSISTGQRLPASFNFPHASSPPSSTSSGSLGSFSTPSGTDLTKDPALYTSLLPRPGSNDNSWESLIEVTKTSETSKLQQLVDNIEHKLTDPNQCVICHRVLSCKSALQMHYRTHTGERPFKCKICGRAFTTKGNLKTHMGVHRAKPPMRVLHQCPVCHKKFTNALVLQQHIRLHTGEPTDLTPEQIQAAEIKEFTSPGSFTGMPNSVSPFLAQHISIPGLSPLTATNLSLNMKHNDMDIKSESELQEEDENEKFEMNTCEQKLPSFSTSLAALENQVRTITTMASQLTASNPVEDMLYSSRVMTSTPTPQNGEKSPTRSEVESPIGSEIRSSPNQMPVQIPRPPSSQQMNSPTPSESNSLGALDLTPRASQPLSHSPGPSPGPQPLFSNFGLMPPGQGSSPLISSALSSLTSSVLNSTAYSPLGLNVGPTIRGNTTCNICFKTFACNSALEIHYRSHTKERPFKCSVCDRGFSTKNGPGCTCPKGQGRIQDGGAQKPRRVGKKKSPPPSLKIVSSKFPPLVLIPGYATASEWSPLLGNMKQHMLTHKIRDMPHHIFDKPVNMTPTLHTPEEPTEPREVQHPVIEAALPPPPPEMTLKPDTSVKRSTSESELPIPKRNPNMQSSKHLCHVCNKNFSSSSALQIHMRTHTGDKPFRCTVCQKAFTTKGNLKVHMGTHMWSNGASRRGRRMSLDLPPIPMTPKDSEFLQRRPDLFYPYLPAPFLNGMQQKLNEISVIQNANNSTGKYTGLLGFGYPPPDTHRSQSGSPLSEKPSTRPSSHEPAGECGRERDILPRMWDLHYERKPAPEQSLDMSSAAVSSNPPPLNLPPPPRGEGLAA